MKSASAIVLAVERSRIDAGRRLVQVMGGGWRSGFEAWAALPSMPYALLIAPDPARIRAAAPYVLTAVDLDTLAATTRAVCSGLSDVTCAWMHVLEPEAKDVVWGVALADAAVIGGVQ